MIWKRLETSCSITTLNKHDYTDLNQVSEINGNS